jgi:hypothetical protein
MVALMNAYSIQELLSLSIEIGTEDITGGAVSTPEGALMNVYTVIRDYFAQGSEVIHNKLLEFAEIGKIVPYENEEIHPHLMVYQLLYEMDLDEMPKYINTPYASIASWRLCLPKE